MICQPCAPASQEAGFLIERDTASGVARIVLIADVSWAWIVSTPLALGPSRTFATRLSSFPFHFRYPK